MDDETFQNFVDEMDDLKDKYALTYAEITGLRFILTNGLSFSEFSDTENMKTALQKLTDYFNARSAIYQKYGLEE